MMNTVWKVLLVDEDGEERQAMSATLQAAGYDVVCAQDEDRGLELCRHHQPHIVIVDIERAETGRIEFLRKIKEIDPDMEVIVVTSFGDINLAFAALQLDSSDYIVKPVTDEILTMTLRFAGERYATRKNLGGYTAQIEQKWLDTSDELTRILQFQDILIESSIDGIMACDRNRRIVIFNRRMEEILGYSKKEVIGKMLFSQIFPQGELGKLEEKLYSEGFGGKNKLSVYETSLFAKDGVKVPAQLSASVLFRDDEEIGVVGFFRDLRDIRELTRHYAHEARLLHHDKMISLGELAASVVHEINNPIAGMLNYCRLMLKILGRGPLTEESGKKFLDYLALIENQLSRCSLIVIDLLTFSRKSRMEFVEVSVNEVIEKCLALSDHRLTLQNIHRDVRLHPDLPKTLGNFNQLQQCMINLIFNAIDAMPAGGDLTIRSSFEAGKKLIVIRVQDSGCGILKENLERMFEPFFTTKGEGKGLGLGLFTVKGIIERHKGSIGVESEVGKGTVFTLKLPIRAEGEEEAAEVVKG